MFIGIVADDLTGAADSVAPFAQRGYVAGVGLSVERRALDPDRNWDALALNTELRDQEDLRLSRITSVVRRAARRLIDRAPDLFFKKIDSTLRGYLRPELDVLLRELPGRIALVCPASPANGRTVENGILRVDGVPLAQTGFAQGIAQAEKFNTVQSAFEMAGEPTAVEMSLITLREGLATVETELDRHSANGVRIVFCDAVTPDDLRTLAEVVLRRPARYLPVGSAGFTRAIAESLPIRASDLPFWDAERFVQGRILVVVGSMHPMSRLQARRLMRETGVRPIILGYKENWDTPTAIRSVQERFQRDEKLYVLMTPEERMTPDETNTARRSDPLEGITMMLSMRGDRHQLPRGFMPFQPFDGYIFAGGHTAQQVCGTAGGRELRILGESEPGIVRALLSGGHRDVPIILKAGGFGDEGTLVRCLGLE